VSQQKTTVVPEEERIRRLNQTETRTAGRYVLYWMQQAQRTRHNPALEFAIRRANALELPLVVGFGLMDDYPEASERPYFFMLQGLREVQENLRQRGIALVVLHAHPTKAALDLGKDAAEIVCDRGYLRHQKQWRREVADNAPCAVWEVEGEVTVPLEQVSSKREHAARTIRPKINRQRDPFLVDLRPNTLEKVSLKMKLPAGLDLDDPAKLCDQLNLDRSVPPVPQFFTGGEDQARRIFLRFLEKSGANYAQNRMHPHTDDVSYMSMYLHFGQVSPVWLLLEARKHLTGENQNSFVEELLVRRELAMNFVEHTPDYDQFSCLPDYAQKTLKEHARDPRPHTYSREQLEAGKTHDHYWNAAMLEMRETGYMHNYMRMYWGKKILEWSADPEKAFATALALNNKYFLDGRDANSFTGVAWVFGNHDHGWTERPIYGKIRCMMASGLERKTNPKAYVDKVRLRTGT